MPRRGRKIVNPPVHAFDVDLRLSKPADCRDSCERRSKLLKHGRLSGALQALDGAGSVKVADGEVEANQQKHRGQKNDVSGDEEARDDDTHEVEELVGAEAHGVSQLRIDGCEVGGIPVQDAADRNSVEPPGGRVEDGEIEFGEESAAGADRAKVDVHVPDRAKDG
jgi:hypothetical protein